MAICEQIQHKLITKYKLNSIQVEILDDAIRQYDFEQNKGTKFTDQFEILSLFFSDILDTVSAPTSDCVFALCEYILETIQYYENTNVAKYAHEILQHKTKEVFQK